MNPILCFDTSTKACSVMILDGDKVLANEYQLFEQYAHAENLNPMIERNMKKAGIKFNQLAAVAVGMGPGSYTGLRIGISAAKGFCYALKIPLIAISTLEILAHSAQEKNPNKSFSGIYVPMLDARRMEVYTAAFDCNLNRLKNDKAVIIDANFISTFPNEDLLFFGDGTEKCKSLFDSNKKVTFLDGIYPDVLHCQQKIQQKYLAQEFEDVAYFEPEYLKEFNSHN